MTNENLYFQIELTMRRVRQHSLNELRKRNFDITIEQWLVLKTVFEQKSVNQLKIGEMLYRDKPTISRMVKSLEKKGYLKRSPSEEDLRENVVELTQEGEKYVEAILPTVLELREKGLGNLNPQEREFLTNILQKIRNNINH
jgi:DNA-binding MarR family transcriptional regulator